MAASAQLATAHDKSSSYYRSHLYTSYTGINPLITAGHPLLSIIDRIQLSRQVTTSSDFYSNLQYELAVFESRARTADYDEETIFIAHFLLSATIHEKLYEKKQSGTFKKLMPPSSKEEAHTPEDQFFEILDKVIAKPELYLDLLELIYLCLSLGFEGKYRHQEHKKLKQIMSQVYSKISQYRQNKQKILFEEQQMTNHKPTIAPSNHSVRWLVGAICIIAATLFASSWLLDNKTSSLMNGNLNLIQR